MRYFFLLLLLFTHPFALGKSSKKQTFLGTTLPLTKKEAQQIWTKVSSHLDKMKQNCSKKITMPKKISFNVKQMQEMIQYSEKTYKKYRYSFYKVEKQRYGENKGSLGVILLDIKSVLNSPHINYKKIKSEKNSKKACEKLRTDFLLSHSIYYNTPDNTPIKKEMVPWAKSIDSSLECLCPQKTAG